MKHGGRKMQEPQIVINTSMEKEDYRKFLYIATFKKKKFTVPLLCLISLFASMIIGFDNGYFHLTRFIVSWIFLTALAIVVIIFKIERQYSQRVKTDKTGTFESMSTFKFYEDRIVMENETLKSTGELKYNQFFAVLESKDYFIFYLTANQASLIRKKDVTNLDEFKAFVAGKFKTKYKKI